MLAWSGKLPTIRAGRRWRPGPIQLLLATGFLAAIGVILVILIQDIHPAANKFTLQKDAAELASLERKSSIDVARVEAGSLPSPPASNAGIDLVETQLEEDSESEAPQSSLIASRASSPERKRSTHSDGGRKSRAAKGLQNPQTRRVADSTRQRYEHGGLGSFFAGIGHALGFSRN